MCVCVCVCARARACLCACGGVGEGGDDVSVLDTVSVTWGVLSTRKERHVFFSLVSVQVGTLRVPERMGYSWQSSTALASRAGWLAGCHPKWRLS